MDEKNSKEELLSELYAIRATMSIVSEKDDSAEPTRQGLSNSQSVIQRHSSDCEKNNRTLIAAQNAVEGMKKRREENMKDVKENSKFFFLPFRAGENLGEVCIYSFIGGVIFSFVASFMMKYWWIFFFAVPIVSALVYCMGGGIIESLALNSDRKRRLSEAQKRLEYSELKLKELNDELQKANLKYQQESTVIERNFEEANSEKKLCEQKLTEIGLESQAIIDCARETYRSIDYRDWENVDLLIYYFETGRADSLKEALQLVDRQKQTNEIVSAIRYASKAISMTIESSVKKLGQALALSFDRLSAQIGIQHRELIDSFEKQRLEISENMEKSAELQMISQQMQTSLLQKIDRSSADLKEDMEKQLRYVHGIYY